MILKSCRPAYWQYFAIMRYATIAFILLILLLAFQFNLWGNTDLLITIIVLYLLAVLSIALYIKVVNDAITYEAGERELARREGIIRRHHTIVSYVKITNVSVRRGILDRIFGLGTLYIDTASGRETYEITMNNLNLKDLEDFTNIIKEMLEKRRGPHGPSPEPPKQQSGEPAPSPRQAKGPAGIPPASPGAPDEGDAGKQRLAELEYRAYVRQPGYEEPEPAEPKKTPAKKRRPARRGKRRKS